MLCHPEPGSAVSYALRNAKSLISMESWTLLSVVLTPWPPGPDDFANRSVRSAAAMTAPSGIPGPGAMVRSFMQPSLGALRVVLVSAETKTASRRTGICLRIILVVG